MKIFAYRDLSSSHIDFEKLNPGYRPVKVSQDCWFVCSQDLYDDHEHTIAFLGDLFNLEDLKRKYGHESTASEFEYLVKAIKDGTFRNEEHEGSFCLIVYEKASGRFSVHTDPFGDLYPYYSVTDKFVLISTHMTDFSDPRYFELNPDWIRRYFQGNDTVDLMTVIKGVSRLRSGRYLQIQGQQAVEHQYFDLLEKIRTQMAKPRLEISIDEAVDEFSRITIANLRSVFKKYKKPILFLSQGIDSVSLLALMAQAGLPLLSMTRIPDNDFTDECLSMHRRILEKVPHENHHHKIIGDRVFLELQKSYYTQPDNNTWQTLGINHGKSVVPSLELGADCVISASMGDFLFIHRTRYLFTHWLAQTGRGKGDDSKLENLKNDFFASLPGFENDYAYNPHEINERLLRLFRAADHDFWRFFAENLHIWRGVSHDRDNRLAGKISVVDPFKDTRLFDFFYLLPEDHHLLSMKQSIFQEKMITRTFNEKVYLQKKANPFALGLVAYKYQDAIEGDLQNALDLLNQLQVESYDYYQNQLSEQKRRGSMDLVLCRMLTFYYWHQNWLAARRTRRTFWRGVLRPVIQAFTPTHPRS